MSFRALFFGFLRPGAHAVALLLPYLVPAPPTATMGSAFRGPVPMDERLDGHAAAWQLASPPGASPFSVAPLLLRCLFPHVTNFGKLTQVVQLLYRYSKPIILANMRGVARPCRDVRRWGEIIG